MSFFFFKQKTAYERRISDWSSDVCSSDLQGLGLAHRPVGVGFLRRGKARGQRRREAGQRGDRDRRVAEVERDRKRVVAGKSVSVRVDLGGRRIIKKNNIDDDN